jgi:hypothetical protein
MIGFLTYPLSPDGGEGQGEGEIDLFSAPINNFMLRPPNPIRTGREEVLSRYTPPSRCGKIKGEAGSLWWRSAIHE